MHHVLMNQRRDCQNYCDNLTLYSRNTRYRWRTHGAKRETVGVSRQEIGYDCWLFTHSLLSPCHPKHRPW